MRTLFVCGLPGLFVALSGCGSPASSANAPWFSEAQLQENAGKFKANPKPDARRIGEPLPRKFTDSVGQTVDLESFRGKANVVLVTVKGWFDFPTTQFCPGCLTQAHALSTQRNEFARRDAQILMVFPGPRDKIDEFLRQSHVAEASDGSKNPFPIIFDENCELVRALGVQDRSTQTSTFILDKKGTVVFSYMGSESFDRPSVDAILNQLDIINSKK